MVQADSADTTNTSGVTLTRKGERYVALHGNQAYFAAMAKLRREAEDEIDRLLAFLDNLDGDPDFEPEQEVRIHFRADGSIEVEEYDDSDLEPSIGRPEMMDQAKAW